MGDLISRQAALDTIEWTWAGKTAFDALKALPSADAVDVVRCKDCKWWRDTDHTCKEHSLVSPMGANEFCSRGERKDGERNGTDIR